VRNVFEIACIIFVLTSISALSVGVAVLAAGHYAELQLSDVR
jgi:hypothetical protein